MDVAAWLRELGLGQYEQAFRENEVDAEVLPRLTADDLKDMGVTAVGHRRRLLDAITALRASGEAPSPRGTGAGVAASSPAASTSTAQAERRQLTVLFADLVGSTALSARLDPEEMRELLGAYQRSVAAEIGRHGGHVAKYLGDGVLAYFGYPRAQEDDAERAVRAGLAAAAAITALRAAGEPLAARVGIATGVVVVGDLIGEGAAREEAVVGETPNLAARLQSLAEPGTVVIAEGTRRLVGDLFECRDLGPLAAKGFPEPVPAYEVLRAGTAESRFEALHATLTPLVGRDEELELLVRRWRQAKGGEGRVVLLSGEPGVGKSRLLAALQDRLDGEPHVRLRYFCSPHHEDSALHPVVAQLERAAGFAREDPPAARLAKLEALLARTATPPAEVALLADLLSLPTGDRYPPLSLTPRQRRERTFAALLRQLDGLSRQGPVLAVFEDAHWIDPSTRELLDLVVERAAGLPLLLIVTHRPEFRPPWAGQPHATTLVLSRLARREAAALVRSVAGADLPDALVEEIVERTDGVPLFVEELTKAALEAGGNVAASKLGIASPGMLTVPATLHASLLARLDRLAPEARTVAQVGAVIGREFSGELLAAVAGLGEADLATALDQLATAGLIFRTGAGSTTGHLFKHVLVRDAAYDTLLRERRRQLHAGVARALEERWPELVETAPELVAHHLTEAGEAGRAVGYWLKAGRRSAERLADQESVQQLRRGLAMLAKLPPSTDRDRLELDLQLALGPRLVCTLGYTSPEAAAVYERAEVLCDHLDEVGRVLPALYGLFAHRLVRGECRAARDVAERFRIAAARRGDSASRLASHRLLGSALMQLGSLREARSEIEAALALYDPRHHRALAVDYIVDLHGSGLSFRALLLGMLGYPDQARSTAREALGHAAELGHVSTTSQVLVHAGAQLAALLRDYPATEVHAAAIIAAATYHRGYGAVLRGWVLACNGYAQEGLVLAREGVEYNDARGAMWHSPRNRVLLAEIHARLGDVAEALRLVEEAQTQVRRTEEGLWQADVHRAEGELRRLAGATDAEVEACFAAALAAARQQEARLFELRAATSLARLRRDQGRHGEARDVLEPVYGWFTEGLDTPDLRDARELLDELR